MNDEWNDELPHGNNNNNDYYQMFQQDDLSVQYKLS